MLRDDVSNVIESPEGKYLLCQNPRCKFVVGTILEDRSKVLIYSFRLRTLEHVSSYSKFHRDGTVSFVHKNRVIDYQTSHSIPIGAEIHLSGLLSQNAAYQPEEGGASSLSPMRAIEESAINDILIMQGEQMEQQINDAVLDALDVNHFLGFDLMDDINFIDDGTDMSFLDLVWK